MSESEEGPSRTSSPAGSRKAPAATAEVVEVWSTSLCQFEERLAHFVSSGKSRPCNAFAEGEVEVRRVAKANPSSSCIAPATADPSDKYVQLCFRLWSSPWILLERPAAVFRPEPVPPVTALPPLQFESDLKQEDRACASILNRELLNRPAKRVVEPLTAKFTALYNPQWDWSRGVAFALAERNYSRVGDPNASKVFQKPESIQFLVEPSELAMAAGQVEPLFCSLALFHVNLKQKISETFHYASDSSGHMEAVRNVVGPDLQGDILAKHGCIFSVASPSKYVYLVVTVHRVLQGDEEKTAEPYLLSASDKTGGESTGVRLPWQNAARKLSKIRDQTPVLCSRLGASLQQFAFAALPVFDADGKFILADATVQNFVLWPPGMDLCETLLNASAMRKPKTVAGQCTVAVRRVSAKDSFPDRLDTSLSPYNSDSPTPKPGVYLRDMFDLMPVSKALPFTSFVGSLFVSPLSVSLPFLDRRKSVVVRLEFRASDDDAVTVPLKLLFSSTGAVKRILTDTARATVVFGAKSPAWLYEELRVQLPAKLTEKHHLMVFFSEVDVAAVRKGSGGGGSSEQLLGVSIVSLLNASGALLDTAGAGATLSLPVVSCAEPLPRGYLSLAEAGKLPLLENGKEVFRVLIRGFSSTLSSNDAVSIVMRSLKQTDSDLLISALKDLCQISVDLVVPHFPSLFQVLFHLLSSNHDCAQQVFQTLVLLLSRVHGVEKRPTDVRTGLVHHFIEYVFEPMDPRVTTGLITQFVTFALLIKKSVCTISPSVLFSVSWMLFDLIVKAMVMSPKPPNASDRMHQFSADFPRYLKKLCVELRALIVAAVVSGGAASGESLHLQLNVNMAMFLSDLVCVYDRGVICDAVLQHVDEMNAQIAAKRAQNGSSREALVLSHMMLDFYKLFADNENFVALNLPKRLELAKDSMSTLCESIEEKHPLVTKLIECVVSELIDNGRFTSRCLSLSILVNLITKIDRDARFNDPEDRHRIALMFFPLLLRLVRQWKETEPWRKDGATSSETTVDNKSKSQVPTSAEATVSSAAAAAAPNPSRLYERQELAASLIWTLRNLDRAWLRQWVALAGSASVFEGLLPILEDLLQVFCKRLDAMNFATPFCTTSANVEALMDIAKHGSVAPLKLRMRLGVRGVTAQQSTDASVDANDETSKRARHLAHYVMLFVVGLGADVMADCKEIYRPGSESAALAVSSLLLALLSSEMAAEAAPVVFDCLNQFVTRQGPALFKALKSETSRLIAATLRLCSFHCPGIRAEASAFLYFLVTQNLKHAGTIEVVKNAAILACSRLAEEQKDFGGPTLQNALNTISEYALQDLFVPPSAPSDDNEDDLIDDGSGTSAAERRRLTFVKQVQEFCRALAKIVRDTHEIVSSRGSSDVEKVAEQYFRVAEGYRNSPELRVEWLEKLAQFHAKNGDLPEASLAMTHVLALVSDYLNNCTDTRIDTSVFKRISPTIAEFYSEEGASTGSASFSLRHFKFVAKAAIKFFEQAELYEMASEVFRLLLAFYHAEGSYRDLTNAHTQLEGFYTKLSQNDANRLLGKYYRVGFYGSLFGPALDGQEFVYKEKLLTHLFSLKERLTQHFGDLLGHNRVEVLEHGGLVDTTTLDPMKAYLQITALRPVWPEEEDATRKSFFQQNTLLSSFAFETPFSKSGKVGQTSAGEQWMRRTILTTENVFPFVLKRVPVRSRKDVVIPPIEIAIEMMQARIEKLRSEVTRNPPDSKTLQQVLQGSVLTTVNRGIIEYLEIFLSHPGDYSKQHVRQLRAKFRGFFAAAEAALKVNKEIIEPSQREFHQEMDSGYRELCKMAEPVLKDEDEDETGGTDSASCSPRPGSAANSPRPGGGGGGRASAASSPRSSPNLARASGRRGSIRTTPLGVASSPGSPRSEKDALATSPRNSPKLGRASSKRTSIRTTPLNVSASPSSPRGERESADTAAAAAATATAVGEDAGAGTPPVPVIAAVKKSAHRLSADKPRRAQSTLSVPERKTPVRVASTSHVGKNEPK